MLDRFKREDLARAALERKQRSFKRLARLTSGSHSLSQSRGS